MVTPIPLRVLAGWNAHARAGLGRTFPQTNVAGVALTRSLDGTVGARSSAFNAFDIYAADAGIAGGNVVASGSFGNGGTLGVSTHDLSLAALGSSTSPLGGGRITAVARLGGSIAAPQADAGVALSQARLRGQPVEATAALAYSKRRLDVVGGSILVGAMTVGVSGRVDGLAPGRAPQYDLDAHVRGGDIGVVAAAMHAGVPLTGSVDADVHIGGSGTAPRANGQVDVPEGSVNGQFYHDAHAHIDGSAAGIVADGGRVTVGTSTLAFDGGFDSTARRLHVSSQHVDLADFNDLFDPGDTLAGTGWIDANVALLPAALRTSGGISLAGARYRRYSAGAVAAQWHTTGRTIAARTDVAGAAGNLSARVSALLPPERPLDGLAERSVVDVAARARGIDLGTWLPAAGYYQPVAGRLDADLSAHGTPARATVEANASLNDGVIGRLALNRFTVAGTARNGRATISSLVLDAPSLAVTANGSFGLRPSDAVVLQAHVQKPERRRAYERARPEAPGRYGSRPMRWSRPRSSFLATPSLLGSVDVTQLGPIVAFAYHALTPSSPWTVRRRNCATPRSISNTARSAPPPTCPST